MFLYWITECDISSRDFSVSRVFSIFWEYRSRKFWSRKKVSVSVSKIFSLKKKSRYRSPKYLVSKKSLGIGLENFGLKKVSVSVSKILVLKKVSVTTLKKFSRKSLGIGLKNIWSRKKVSVSKILVSKKSLGIGLDEIFWSRHSVLNKVKNGPTRP